MAITPEIARQTLQDAELIFSAADVAAALDRMAAQIQGRLQDKDPLVLSVMIGGLMPAGLLLSRLRIPLQVDYVHATRYRGGTTGGTLHWIVRPRADLRGRTVLLVDDILDEGHTLAEIVQECRKLGAAEVLTAVLLDKIHGREKALAADFYGLQVGDRYVFGFGMDYKEYWRNLPEIYAVRENG